MLTLLEVESLTFPIAAAGAGFILIGFLMLRHARRIYKEAVPRFVVNYRGGPSPLLAFPYGAGFFISTGVAVFKPVLPVVAMNVVSLVMVLCLPVFLVAGLIWFPRFLLPPWYRRAVKAGIPRNDPYAMGAFKALPVDEQRAAVARHNGS